MHSVIKRIIKNCKITTVNFDIWIFICLSAYLFVCLSTLVKYSMIPDECRSLSFLGECDYPPYYDHTILREEYQAHSPSEFIEGFKVAYYCQSGYVRTAGSASITCINKMWSALTLKCERKYMGLGIYVTFTYNDKGVLSHKCIGYIVDYDS